MEGFYFQKSIIHFLLEVQEALAEQVVAGAEEVIRHIYFQNRRVWHSTHSF